MNDDKCLDATYKRFIKSPFTGVPIQFRLRGREKRGENKSGKGISRKSWAHHKK